MKSDFPLFSTADGAAESTKHKDNVVVLMSGGVDSSASALLLQQAGCNITGLTMKILDSGERAIESAADVCRALSIPHFWVDLRDAFRLNVMLPFCEAYRGGETPNPCANCNERVKLGLLARIVSANWGEETRIATGHYARIAEEDGRVCLARAQDKKKDQSYFLAGVPRAVIERIVFPLGEMTSKDETRELVRKAGIAAAERPDSMEICFAAEEDYRRSLDVPGVPGPILDTAGAVIGRHTGIANYTLGQRKGLGVAAKHPLYVVEIRPAENVIVAADKNSVFTPVVHANKLNLLLPEKIKAGTQLFGKIRSQGEPMPCRIQNAGGDSLAVLFEKPVFAPAPGQRLVLYTGNGNVAMGGVITR